MTIPYENQTDITKRKEVTQKPQTTGFSSYKPQTTENPAKSFSKNTVDKPKSIMYNDSKESTGLSNTYVPGTLLSQAWKDKNKYSMRYAGDSAKKSIDIGLKEAPDYMKDADEGTKFEDVQSASVKWKLANDSNNSDLVKKASMELIGHLSKENKEPYLKHAEPLQTYIDAKDEFDYKHKNYTTTEFLDPTPDENVRQTQRMLNESGYTDKFGEKLKEDGIEGAKTRYAKDNFEANNYKYVTPKGANYQIDYAMYYPERDAPRMLTDEELRQKYSEPDVKTVGYNLMDKELFFKPMNKVFDYIFDYNTRLSYSQNYSENVEILQNKLVELGYLYMSNGGWGYYGPRTLDAVNRYKQEKGLGNTGNDAGVVGKDTWESLGLLCRSKKDVDAGVRVVTIGTHQYYDLSYAIHRALSSAVPEFEKHKNDNIADKMIWFAKQVGNNGDWNIKRDKNVWEKTLNISSDSFSEKFFFYGNYIGREALGNITYGYLGKALGLSDFELMGGSLANDLITHLGGNLQNELVDHRYIRKGIDLYNGKDIREYLKYEV